MRSLTLVMRSQLFVIAALIGLMQSPPAHATTPAESAAAFSAMRNHIQNNLGSLIRPEALANILKQVDRAQARSNTQNVTLTQVRGAMVLEASTNKGRELLEMRPAPYPYAPFGDGKWTFDATHQTSGNRGVQQTRRHYTIDQWGHVAKSGDLSVWQGDRLITSFQGRGTSFSTPHMHIYPYAVGGYL